MASFNLKAIISATDKLTPVLNQQMKSINKWKRQFKAAGEGGIAMGAGLAAGLLIPAKAFADVENATMGLKNTLMDKNGVSRGFDNIVNIATDLGNQLPGTTADFMNMASQLNSLDINPETIAGGALKATAYLAVVGERFHVTYESAANAVGKLGKSFGLVDKEYVPFADTLQRALHLGADLTEMQYAMVKPAALLNGMGKGGLKAANDTAALSAMLIGKGFSGDSAGSGIEKLIQGATKAGKFQDIPKLVGDLEKFNKLKPPERMLKFMKLFGEEGARVAMVVSSGGFGDMVKRMEQQAAMQQRINNSLGTLTNLWEAATGTFTNALAAIGEVYAPELKILAQSVNDVSGKLMDWAKANGPMIKTAIALAGGFVTMKIGMLAMAGATGIATAAMRVFTGAAKVNPFMLLLQGLLIAVPLIIQNWDWVVENVGGSIDKMVKAVGGAWDGVVGKLKSSWEAFIEFLKPGIDTIKFLFNGIGSAFSGVSSFFSGIKLPEIGGFSLPESNGMRPPGYEKNSILKPNNGAVHVGVSFENAPSTMRVAPAKTSGPVRSSVDVGYGFTHAMRLGL